MRLRASLASLICLLAVAPAHAADEITSCTMGGPTPGSKTIRFDLPEGTDFLSLEPRGTRPVRPVSDEKNWHLAEGIVIVNLDTHAIEAYRVESSGSAPRRVIVRADGTTVVDQGTTAPDGPFYHTSIRNRPGLPAGSYLAVGFGTDGSAAFPNEQWGAQVRLAGTHACTPYGAGATFEFDQSRFGGGTQVYLGPYGMARDIEHARTIAPADLVVGLMDAAVQGSGTARLAFETPAGSGVVEDAIVPFVSTEGTHRFTGSYDGIYPLLLVAGVALDLP